MKKFIPAALLVVAFSTQATEFYTENDLANMKIQSIDEAARGDMLESYKRGLEKVMVQRETAEMQLKVAELELEISKMKRDILLNRIALEAMEKNK